MANTEIKPIKAVQPLDPLFRHDSVAVRKKMNEIVDCLGEVVKAVNLLVEKGKDEKLED